MNDLKFVALNEGCFVTLIGPRDEVGDHAIPVTKPCQTMAEVAAEIECLKCELDAAAEAARNHFGRN